MNKIILLMIVVFIAGWGLNSAYSSFTASSPTVEENALAQKYQTEEPRDNVTEPGPIEILWDQPGDKISPYDHITEDQIHVFQNKVIIDIQNAEWARFTDTKSMDPVIDLGTNAIEIRPASPEQIHEGDIVSYRSKYADGIIIHRVIETGYDNKGWYAKMKGDNNMLTDPGKIRFDQVERMVVAIIY